MKALCVSLRNFCVVFLLSLIACPAYHAEAQTSSPATDLSRVVSHGFKVAERERFHSQLGIGLIVDVGAMLGQHRSQGLYISPVSDALSFEGNCSAKLGNPITITTGNKVETDTDFATVEEYGLHLTRSWNQRLNDRGLFGFNWISNFDKKLIFKWENGQVCSSMPGSGCGTGSSRLVQVYAQRQDGRKILVYQWGAPNPQNMYPISGNHTHGWTLKADGEMTETYNGSGFITSETNAQGIGWTYTYGGSNGTFLQKVTHTNGREVTFGWTGNQVSSVTDPNGASYTYTNTNTQATVTYPGHPAVTNTYHFQNVPAVGWGGKAYVGKSINGVRYSTFSYDAAGRANLSEHAGGVERVSLVYSADTAGNITSVVETNALGKVATHTISNRQVMSTTGAASTNCLSSVRAYSYSSFGRQDVIVDENGVMSDYDYNGGGQLIKLVEAVGTPAERTTTYTWDASPKNRLLTQTRPGMWRRSFTYHANGRLATETTENLSAFGVAGQAITTSHSYTYHANGMVASHIVSAPGVDPLVYHYTSKGELASIVNGLGHVSTFSGFNGLGMPTLHTGVNGEVTAYQYDARGRLTAHTTYPNGSTAATTTYAYGSNGLLASKTSPGSVTTFQSYDAALRSVLEYRLIGGVAYEYVITKYNNASDTTAVIIGKSTSVPTVNTTSGITRRIEFDYDELSRRIGERGNSGQNVRYSYDLMGNLKTVIDSLGRPATYTYDALNRVIQSTDRNNQSTFFEYDSMDQLKKVTDPRGKLTTYVNDGLGLLWAQHSPDTGTTSHQYNIHGQRTYLLRNDGSTLAYNYDSLGRLTWYGTSTEGRGYGYDWCGNGKGRLCNADHAAGTRHYGYSPYGSVTVTRDWTPSSDEWTHYAYDAVGRLGGITYPSGVVVGYGYFDDRLTLMQAAIGGVTYNVVTGINYQPHGPIDRLVYGNSVLKERSFDLDGRMTTTHDHGWVGHTQSYNANDEITSIQNWSRPEYNESFAYDAQSRLTSVTAAAGNQSFNYDANGNRSFHSWWIPGLGATANTTYQVDASSNRLTGEDIAYAYDGRGNRSSQSWGGSTTTYGYDSFNRMTTVSRSAAVGYYSGGTRGYQSYPAGTTTYQFNALDQRIAKSGPLGSSRFVHAAQNTLLTEYTGGVWSSYIWLGSEPIAVVRNNQLFFLHNDHLGRPEIVTDSTNSMRWAAANYAFDRSVLVDSMGGLNLGLPGQYFDAETGFWHNGHRDYDSRVGRYIQSDPIGLVGGLNSYSYVDSNPLSRIDFLGLSACADFATNLAARAMESGWSEVFGQKLYSDAWNGRVPLTSADGFRQELIDGGQGVAVGRHIYAAAGGYLINDGPSIAVFGSIVDLGQTVTSGNFAQRRAEIRGNAAGAKIGAAIKTAMNMADGESKCKKEKIEKELSGLISSILCAQ